MLAHMISTSRAEPTIGEAERGIVLWLLRALALLRAAQTLPWLTVVFAGRWETYRHPGLVVGLYVGYICWAVALFARGLARQGFTRGWVAADVAVTVGCAYVVGRACMPGYATTWQNWTLGPAMGAAILATISVGPLAGVAAASALSVAWAVAAWQDVAVAPSGAGQVLGSIASLVGFTVAAGLFAARLRLSARQADASAAEAFAAHLDQAAAQGQLLKVGVRQSLEYLLSQGEGRTVEFKRQLPKDNNDSKRTALKTIVAFANGAGGTVLYGVDDIGQPIGLDTSTMPIERHRDRLADLISGCIAPEPSYDLKPMHLDDKALLVLHIHPVEHGHTEEHGPYALFPKAPEFYLRHAARTDRASYGQVATAFRQAGREETTRGFPQELSLKRLLGHALRALGVLSSVK